MRLRLSPIPVLPLGHAVHRAPDTERNQHPGYSAAGHNASHSAQLLQVLLVQSLFHQRRREVGSSATLN